MATCTLIPSSLVGGYEITDASNAYYDTSHSFDYASVVVTNISGEENAYLGGFDFSLIPSESRVVNLIVKFKADVTTDSSYIPRATLVSGINGVELSDTISPNKRNSGDSTIYTFNLTASVETIMNYASSLCIRFTHYLNYTTSTRVKENVYIYGAEIIVTYLAIDKNKIIYGNKTLIDLTSDTVTESDVVSGVIFHLPSGTQAIGTFIASPTSKNKATTSATARSVAFTGLTKEPSYFWIMPMIASNTRTGRVTGVVYNGTTTYIMYTDGSNAGKLVRSTSVGSWTYSDGTLTLWVGSSAYLGEATWYIWYL